MSEEFPLEFFEVERFVFARLDEEAAAPGADLAALEALRLVAVWHSIEVREDGTSYWRCATCPTIEGAPCLTIRRLAWRWHQHPRFPEWARSAMDTQLGAEAAAAGGWFALRYPEVAASLPPA